MSDYSLVKMEFQPGLRRDDTGLAAEGGFGDGNLVRARRGRVEPVGGWAKLTASTYTGVARGGLGWNDSSGNPVLAFGTDSKLYSYINSTLNDITPDKRWGVVTGAITLSTTNVNPTDPAAAVTATIEIADHGMSVGETIHIAEGHGIVWQSATGSGPTVNTHAFSGAFTVSAVPNADEIRFVIGSYPGYVATQPGSLQSATYRIPWPATPGITSWSLDTYGEDLVALPKGMGLHRYQPEATYTELLSNGSFTTAAGGNAAGWAKAGSTDYNSAGGYYSWGGTGFSGTVSQDVTEVLEGGRFYKLQFTLSNTSNVMPSSSNRIRFGVNAGAVPAFVDLGEASKYFFYDGTYTLYFICPDNPVDIVFEAQAQFTGRLTDVSIKLMDKAFLVTAAPPRANAMFVDARQAVVLMGTEDTTGRFYPNLVRTSDLSNVNIWIPDNDNYASEYFLKTGTVVAGKPVRQQNLILSADSAFVMRYTGDPNEPFSYDQIGSGCGLIGPLAVCEHNGAAYWLSNAGKAYVFRGGPAEVIDSTLMRDVFDNMASTYKERCVAGINPAFAEVWFFYPDSRDGAVTENSRYVSFNFEEAHWHGGILARSTWVGPGAFENPIGFSSTLIYKHEYGKTADGSAMSPWIETGDFDIEDGGSFVTLAGFIPDIKDQAETITYTLYSRNYPSDSAVTSGPYSYTTTTQKLDFIVRARQARIRIAWSGVGAFGRLGVLRGLVKKMGARR